MLCTGSRKAFESLVSVRLWGLFRVTSDGSDTFRIVAVLEVVLYIYLVVDQVLCLIVEVLDFKIILGCHLDGIVKHFAHFLQMIFQK